MKKSFNTLLVTHLIALILAGFVLLPVAEGAGRGGGSGGRGGGGKQSMQGGGRQDVQVNDSKRDARTDNVRSTSTSNVNVNRNVDVDVDVDRRGGGWDNDYHPVATAAVVTATAAVVGSMVNSVPANCVPVTHNNVVYQQCGSTWYQPQYVGTQVQYEVVNPPR
jgi:hypothetical protein